MLCTEFRNLRNRFGAGPGAAFWPTAAALAALVLWPYWWVKPYEARGDAAFTWYFHEVFERGLIYGSDVFITAGPWSFLYYVWYHPNTFTLMLILQCFVSLCTVAGLCLVIGRVSLQMEGKAVIALISVGALSLSPDARSISHLLLMLLLYEHLDRSRFSKTYGIFLVSCALVGLTKGTFALILALFIPILCARELQDRRFPLYALLLAASTFVWAAIADHGPMDLFRYYRSIFQVSAFYGQVFAEYGSFLVYSGTLSVTAAFGLVIAVTEFRLRGIRLTTFLLVAGYALVLLLILKTGFLRQDGQHVIRSVISIFLFFVLYFFQNIFDNISKFKLKFQNKRIIFIFLFVIVIVISAVISKYPSIYGRKMERVEQQFRGLVDLLFLNGEETLRRITASKADVRTEFQLENIAEPVALLVNNIVPIVFSDLPVFEVAPGVTGYMAASGVIDASNERYVRNTGKNAVIFQRNSLAVSSGTVLALRELFQPESADPVGQYLLLKRREVPKRHRLDCSAFRTVAWGERLSVMRGESTFSFVRLIYKRTLTDALIAAVYKPMPVRIRQFVNGELKYEAPLEDKMARRGFITSPMLVENSEMRSFLLGEPSTDSGHIEIALVNGQTDDPIHSQIDSRMVLEPEIQYQFCTGTEL